MYTRNLLEKGTKLTVFQAEKVTITAEFSHRGEVKDIAQFNIDKKFKPTSIFADKYGIVYRISHMQVEGYSDKKQTVKIREAAPDKVIKQMSSLQRRESLMNMREHLR